MVALRWQRRHRSLVCWVTSLVDLVPFFFEVEVDFECGMAMGLKVGGG
jgi:hypothetical protein